MTTTITRNATDRQLALITKLYAERNLDVNRETDTLLEARISGDMTTRDASRLIDLLLAAPRKHSTGFADVPEGRYALRNADGSVTFWKVDRPEAGKWAGAVFCKQVVSDYEQRHPIATQKAIMARIFVDLEAAMALYGQEIGRCGHCHRQLTSEWRQRGIGPRCAAKMGW